MKPIGIFYGSTTGKTEIIAKKIKNQFTDTQIDIYNVRFASEKDLEKYDNIILGTSTWGKAELQKDFKDFLSILKKANLRGKKIAIFGVGDSSKYPVSFADSIGIVFEVLEGKGAIFVGEFSVKGYHFESSLSIFGDKFAGLPIDEDSECDLNKERISMWTDLLKLSLN
ncbi:MAG: flavodoxin [Bacteroidetes bacterium GWC2_33_15]|nr:MAG: flavodoxin [Bacteroidetes bacterium GWA2_33_15]OFX49730.1 MAG: flavodoxin [Bacteroidetes bacterium GWC2_33_15]OFX65880.1 MAG: flavodoxin [Bacteroidetes bacterium GWB2_32_14]OFX68359.1 MAG: flavodoxin [Bacteroidetes bacterium GWD2_33_33]HAN18147.1 flavodoxin [Bacteroidales bacterium]